MKFNLRRPVSNNNDVSATQEIDPTKKTSLEKSYKIKKTISNINRYLKTIEKKDNKIKTNKKEF